MRFWMLGFARNIPSKGHSIGEKIWLVCATVAGVVALAWNHAGSVPALELRSQVICCLFLLTLRRCAIVFCNSVSADRSVVAVCRFLAAAAACMIILSFAAENCKSYCVEIAAARLRMVLWHQIFCYICAVDFAFNISCTKCSNSKSFFRFGVKIRFWSCNLCCWHA